MTNQEKLDAIYLYQECGIVHPLTCEKDSNHENLIGILYDGDVVLWCPTCGNIQDWVPETVYQIIKILSGKSNEKNRNG